MFPVVSEVVDVGKPESLAMPLQEFTQQDSARVLAVAFVKVVVQQVRVPKTLWANLKLVEMTVRPAHGVLDVLV